MVGADERSLKESATWNHMKNVLGHIIAQRPDNALATFESFSNLALEGTLQPAPVTTQYMDNQKRGGPRLTKDQINDVQWARKFSSHLAPPAPAKKSEEDEDPVVEEDKGEMSDIVSEQRVFNTFGEGLTEEDAFRVTVALKRLLDKEPLAKVRFWGKITGTVRDYFICEAKIDESRVPEVENAEPEVQETTGKPLDSINDGLNTHKAKDPVPIATEEGKGVNEMRYYYATSDDLTSWTQLPDAAPAHIAAARKISKMFSGNPEARVETHPPFPGVEKHYLRAQIARISHATVVCPRLMFTTDVPEEEEDENGNKIPRRFEVQPYEEVPPLNPQETPDLEDPEAVAPVKMWVDGYRHDELLEPSNWVHYLPQLLAEGRVTKFKPEDQAEEEDEDTTVQPFVEWIHPFLAETSKDDPLRFEMHSQQAIVPWACRKAYHCDSDETRAYLVRSLLWPGAAAYAVAKDGVPGASFQNVYIGNGLKREQTAVFTPAPPPITSVEYPVAAVPLQKDGTYDDELEFEPAPPPPKVPGAEEEEAPEDE